MQLLLQWKSKSIAYSECVFVAIVMQHALCVRHIVICTLSGSTIIFHIISSMAQFKKKVSEHKMCYFHFLYSVCLKHFSFQEALLEKYSDIKFHENPSSGSRVVPCRCTSRNDKDNSRFLQFCKGA